MTKKQLQKAFDNYAKTGDLKPLTGMLKRLLLYMAEQVEYGFSIEFIDMLPFIVKSLNGLDFSNGKKKKP